MKIRSLISAAALLASVTGAAQANHTGTVSPAFASLQVYAGDSELNDPVITLGDDDCRLTVEFDEIADDVRYMRYSITHCDASWQPSQLTETEYLDGFNEGTVDEWEFSRATTVGYVHYRIVLPNDRIRLRVSGNYVLRVYDESDPDNTLLRARFMVTEQTVGLSAEITSHTDVDYNDAHQQLSLTIDPGKVRLNDAFTDFKVVVSQNGRPDNERILMRPSRMQGGMLVYEHTPQLIFEAGNEYRRFENTSTRSTSMRIGAVEYHPPYYHAYIETDVPRNETQYLYDSTQHGKFVVREYNSTLPDTEADYLVTHFALAMPELDDADIYLDGDLVNRRYDGRSRLSYNEATGCYETALLLKQGSYNYQYLTRRRGKTEALTGPVEGDFHNTVNLYRVAVYHRFPGERYDHLAGYFTIKSQ